MGVTNANRSEWVRKLRLFLNAKVKRREGSSRPSLNDLFQPGVYWDLSRVEEKDEPLQDELIEDLTPIVEGKELDRALSRLVSKINQLKLRTEWILVGGKGYRIPPLAYRQLGPGRGILKSARASWVVARKPWLQGDRLKEILYEITLNALLDGSLVYLKRCPQCQNFFVAKNTRGQFCTPNCKIDFHNIRRAKEGYFLKRRKRKERERRSQRRQARFLTEAKRFNAFLEETKGNVSAGSRTALFIKKKIPGEWNTVRKWQRAEQKWNNLPNQEKTRFREWWEEENGVGSRPLNFRELP